MLNVGRSIYTCYCIRPAQRNEGEDIRYDGGALAPTYDPNSSCTTRVFMWYFFRITPNGNEEFSCMACPSVPDSNRASDQINEKHVLEDSIPRLVWLDRTQTSWTFAPKRVPFAFRDKHLCTLSSPHPTPGASRFEENTRYEPAGASIAFTEQTS